MSCLIALARTSSTMMNRGGTSGHPCLVPKPRGKALSLSLSRILAVVFLSVQSEEVPFYSQLSECLFVFITEGCWILSNTFNVSTEMMFPLFYQYGVPASFFFYKLIYLFNFWLRWVFVAVRGLLTEVASLCCGAQALGTRAAVVVARGL